MARKFQTSVDMNSFKVANVADPTATQDAATKNYVDTTKPIIACRLATAAVFPAYARSTNTITASSNGVWTIDGKTLTVGDIILLKNGAAGADNGPYSVTTVGTAGVKTVLDRIPSFDASADVIPGSLFTVSEGTANDNTTWRLTTDAAITLNTTALTFARLSPDIGGVWGFPSLGNAFNGAPGANFAWYTRIAIPHRTTITGVRYYVGTTQSGNVKSSLYDVAGARVANCTSTNAQPVASAPHDVPFDAAVVVEPGLYYECLTFSSGTGTAYFNSTLVPTGFVNVGSFVTPTSITPPTGLSNTPMASTY